MDKSTQTSVFPLLELPNVVVGNLLTFLPPNTCLALRRVCKQTYGWICDMSCTRQELSKWKKYHFIVTGKAPNTFALACKINLPISTFYLRNSSSKCKIYESEGVEQFIQHHKNRQISFVVDKLCLMQLPEEQNFYFNFEKVTALKVKNLMMSLSRAPQLSNASFLPPPVTFTSSVRKIVIEDFDSPSSPSGSLSEECVLNFITSFKNLEYLSPPSKSIKICSGGFPWIFRTRTSTYCPDWINAVGQAIVNNNWTCTPAGGQSEGENNSKLKAITNIGVNSSQLSLDLRAFAKGRYTETAYQTYVQNYVHLLQMCHRHNILLHNVHGPLLESMYSQWLDIGWTLNMVHEAFRFLENVVSLYCIRIGNAFGEFCDMKRLEEITIFHHFANHQWLYYHHQQLKWEHLKTLNVSVCIREKDLTELSKEVWNVAFLQLFKNSSRSSVTNLKLKLRVNSKNQNKMIALWKVVDFQEKMFDLSIITTNFINLKCITIHGWLASDKQFNELFSGLPKLECVSIGGCRRLGDMGLKNMSEGIRTLTLNLDDMPLITPFLFINVLSHMPLKELRINAKKPLDQITKPAILALQEGTFGGTIEKFPFSTWKSKYIKGKEKSRLRKGFHRL